MSDEGQEPEQEQVVVREGEHVPPTFRSDGFHCVWCGVLTAQNWIRLAGPGPLFEGNPVWRVACRNCHERSYWLEDEAKDTAQCLYPVLGGGPRPHPAMPTDVRDDYEEARTIVQMSPRGACALLRLAAQKLVDDLQPGQGNLNTKIGTMVDNGLAAQVQQALDVLRVIGNEAVHPGELDLRDDIDTATGLFALLNFIVDDRIERPRRMAEMYAKLPPSKLQQIQQRDTAVGRE